MSDKHAYLIIAHTNFEQLQTLVDLIDDERNDIYLHIDKKARSFSPDMIKTVHSQLTLIDRISVSWGGDTQIKCEVNLLRAAVPKHYAFYHLLSGVDLPLKTQDEIHAFFADHEGKNFIGFDKVALATKNFHFRTEQYHFFRNIVGRRKTGIYFVFYALERITLELQTLLKVRRKQKYPLYKGPNWFSISDGLANYMVDEYENYFKQFSISRCADEVFLQSVAMASSYRETVMWDSLRATDWERGGPYIYRKEDVPELLASDRIFGRKFDIGVDAEAVELIANTLKPDRKS